MSCVMSENSCDLRTGRELVTKLGDVVGARQKMQCDAEKLRTLQDRQRQQVHVKDQSLRENLLEQRVSFQCKGSCLRATFLRNLSLDTTCLSRRANNCQEGQRVSLESSALPCLLGPQTWHLQNQRREREGGHEEVRN